MTQAQQQRVAEKANQQLEQLQQATLQAAFAAAEKGEVPTFAQALAVADQEVDKNAGKTGIEVGSGAAGPGRPKGVRNKLTNLRDSVLEAFDQVGGTEYLARLANGTQSDRAAFVGLVSKVLPTQINANVEGGIQVQLSWLGQRNIGATTTQNLEHVTQVVDLQRDEGGKYRIIDPTPTSEAPAGAGMPEAAKPAGDAQGA